MYPRQEDVSLLQRYINDNKLEDKGVPMTELRRLDGLDQVMLGVDGTKIIDLITQAVREREKMAVYTYTTPFTVYNKITEICETFRTLKNCTPVLVFNGIPFSPDPDEEFTRDRNTVPLEITAFTGTDNCRLCNMPPARASDIQKKSSNRFVVEEDVENQIIKLFRSEFKNTMRAPYLAWAQLSAFRHPENRYVSEVYGCLELLAFPGIDRVITNINVMKGTFDMVRKSRLLDSLRIDDDDLGSLIVIDSRSRVMKPVSHKFLSLDEMCKKIQRVYDFTLGCSYAHRLSEEIASGADPSLRNRTHSLRSAVIRNLDALGCPVLTLTPPHCISLSRLYKGRRKTLCEPRTALGSPLPPVMYYVLSAGLLSPSPLAALCQGSVVDDWPLVDSVKYRDMAEIVLPLRVQTVYQLVMTLGQNDYRMTWFRRYNVPQGRIGKIHPPPDISLDSWMLNGINIPSSLHLVDVLEYAHLATSSPDVYYTTMEETCAAILLQSLDLLGYLTHEARDRGEEVQLSEPSAFGRALKLCSVSTLSEYTVLLIELTRTGAITSSPIRMTQEEIHPRNIPPEVVLASRILSIIPLNVSGPWSGPIDAELAAFSMVSRMISRSIRHLLESIMMAMFYQGKTQVPLHRVCEIQRSLPFSTPVEFGSGVLIQYILMKEKCTLADVEAAFPECTYLSHDLATLFYFWDLAFYVLQSVASVDVSIDLSIVCKAHERMMEVKNNLDINTGVRETYY
ncbi:viral life cyclerelated protein [Trypanosoma theileri]|uniref:Viral life cyclerelated protein n=1 Tax=Trypanosoma theileri TaxID=67003 RepID=A0A1X0P1K6_9TRYP|nr:viral life cyclerelated protein [Trypanosoma theileri]ORC90711.1 viral life cyclerelated protein [Trypanosoma theileri]